VVLDDSIMRRNLALREMMGFARAVVADGRVSHAEAKGLQAWIEANTEVLGVAGVEEIIGILTNAFDDGRLSEPERKQLIDVLERFGG